MRPLRPAAFSCSSWLTRSTRLKKLTAGPGPDHGCSDSDGQVGFASAGSADEDEVALGLHEVAAGQFADQALVDRGVGEDEVVEVLQHGELGATDPVVDRAGLTMSQLGADQAGQERIKLFTARRDPCRRSRRSWRRMP